MPADKRALILAAALRCFRRNGVGRTTMTDIAKQAQVSRITLYRNFDDRAALFEAILAQRFSAMLDALRVHLTRYDRFIDALVLGGEHAIQLGRVDRLYLDIANEGTDHTIESFILNNNPELRAKHLLVWQPVFLKARKTGELQSRLPDERLIEGVRSILNLVLLRDDLSRDDRLQFLHDFLVPAILGTAVPAAQKKPANAARRPAKL